MVTVFLLLGACFLIEASQLFHEADISMTTLQLRKWKLRVILQLVRATVEIRILV